MIQLSSRAHSGDIKTITITTTITIAITTTMVITIKIVTAIILAEGTA